jgi:hypothetical protein
MVTVEMTLSPTTKITEGRWVMGFERTGGRGRIQVSSKERKAVYPDRLFVHTLYIFILCPTSHSSLCALYSRPAKTDR